MTITPHGPGFSFLDRFEIIEPGKRARGSKWLDPAARYFADHFPGRPLMPGVLLVECAAQTAGAFWQRLRNQAEATPVFLAAVQQFRFTKPVSPGEVIEMEVELERDAGTLAQFSAEIRVGATVVAQGKIVMSLQAA